jgi:tetratricopeptide (TPR) repeat protein
MTAGQISLLLASVAMVAVTYLFGPLLPSEKTNPENTAAVEMPTAGSDFDFTAYREEALKIAQSGDDPIAAEARINHFIDSMEVVIRAAITQKEAAEKTNQASDWVAAGEKFYTIATTAPSVGRNFDQVLYVNTIYCYEKALELSPADDSTQINLAVAYMEAQGSAEQVMKGVTILRQITDKDPGNISANLILGKYGIVSGQFDKAVQRFEKVLAVDSLNADAYLYLAQAYEGLGEKDKAIEMLEKCRSVVNDPDFANNIGRYIEKLKNS